MQKAATHSLEMDKKLVKKLIQSAREMREIAAGRRKPARSVELAKGEKRKYITLSPETLKGARPNAAAARALQRTAPSTARSGRRPG